VNERIAAIRGLYYTRRRGNDTRFGPEQRKLKTKSPPIWGRVGGVVTGRLVATGLAAPQLIFSDLFGIGNNTLPGDMAVAVPSNENNLLSCAPIPTARWD